MRAWCQIGALVAALVAGGVLACNSPTIPIPPLHAPSFSSPMMDTWVATGSGAEASSEVFVINRATGDGVVARAAMDGSFTTPSFTGRAGDQIELFYRTPRGELSPSVCGALTVGTAQISACQ